jgi:hypothetical protein
MFAGSGRLGRGETEHHFEFAKEAEGDVPLGFARVFDQHRSDMRANAMLADGAGAYRFVNAPFDDFDPNMIGSRAVSLTIAQCSHRIASAMLAMEHPLINVLQTTIELCLTHPGVDGVLCNGAAAMLPTMLA